jgi:opacity protein-like surface antigen
MKFYNLLCAFIVFGLNLNASERPRLGSEIVFSNPTGTLNRAFSSSQGFGINILAEWELGHGHGLRWDIIGVTNYPRTTIYSNGQALQSTLSSLSSAVNYTYHLWGGPLGPYLLAGAGLTSYSGHADLPGANPPQRLGAPTLPPYNQVLATTSWQPAWLVGVGYDFNRNVGLTVRYHALQSGGHTLGTVETGLSTRF